MATQPNVVDFDDIDTSRYEYVRGRLLERPVPQSPHSRVQANVIEVVGPKARDAGGRILPELTIDNENTGKSEWLTADAALVRWQHSLSKRESALPQDIELVVEILSPGQTVPQLLKKAADYLVWGVETVWILKPAKRTGLIAGVDRLPVNVSLEENMTLLFKDGRTFLEARLADLLG
jgi:Uma2 family endonuclease